MLRYAEIVDYEIQNIYATDEIKWTEMRLKYDVNGNWKWIPIDDNKHADLNELFEKEL